MKKYPDVVFCVDTVSSMGGTSIPVDELGIDFCITSTQKCLGCPPGMSAASVSKKAYERAKTVPDVYKRQRKRSVRRLTAMPTPFGGSAGFI